MSEFMAGLTTAEQVYAVSALIGGLLFIIRTLMTLISGFDHAGADIGGHGDFGGGHGDSGGHASDTSGEADTSFRALSIQGITAFFMMFGLVGLALSRQSGVGAAVSSVGGTLAGLITVWVIGRVFMSLGKMQSDGTLNYNNAIGKEGTVYLTIPSSGQGQVNVAIQEQLQLCQAVAAEKSPISTGERVVVVDVIDGHILVVSKAS